MSLRIVFMGTPDCARPSMEGLLERGHSLMVVCQPDRQRGRGRRVGQPPVKLCCDAHGLPLIQPHSVNTEEAHSLIAEFDPDLYCVVAFGQILKPDTLSIPRLGAINLHFSLLPRWRGAAPVEYAIWHGDAVTGVSTQFMVQALDAGDVIFQAEEPIRPTDTAGDLMQRLSALGAEVLAETVRLIELGEARAEPQDPAGVTLAPRIKPEEGEIDWHADADSIARHIRAFNPRPGCHTQWADTSVKLWRAWPQDGEGEPGEVLAIEGDTLVLAAGQGAVALAEVQPEGRARQTGRDFANGRHLAPGHRLPAPHRSELRPAARQES
ncbi:MAG: methionyl-tRNA formyltransferase [candidate division WS1 bacterium]|jgi:methionyl-tRNA formyltransferase|nr:methionyl-tRNA formyltransferase [candidate division WS1 bacterium]